MDELRIIQIPFIRHSQSLEMVGTKPERKMTHRLSVMCSFDATCFTTSCKCISKRTASLVQVLKCS